MFWTFDRTADGAQVVPVPLNASADGAGVDASVAAATAAALTQAAAAVSAETSPDGGSGLSEPPPVIIAMMAGEAAEWVEESSDEAVLETVMEALRSTFGADAVPPPTAHVITRWRSDPFSRGSYSFLRPGAHGMHYDLMALPVDDAVYFAGEATNRHHPSTAAGAYDSGVREGVRLMRLFGRARDPDVVRLLAGRAARLNAPANL